MARRCEIGVLAVTDHNSTENLHDLRMENPDIRFVQGTEISCLYADVHGVDPTDTLNRRFSRDLCRPLLEALQIPL